METDESINANSFTSEAMNQQENLKNGIGYALYDGNYYLYDIDNDGMACPVMNMGTSLKQAKKITNDIKNGIHRQDNAGVYSSDEQNRDGRNRGKNSGYDSSKQRGDSTRLGGVVEGKQGDRLQHDSEESGGDNEGLDLSGVQLMEGSDGTVYGWVDTTDKVLV